jgi:short-subunit dehydrogenase
MSKGKYVLILGAKSDVGEALAYAFAKNGYHIFLAARGSEMLVPTISDLEIRHHIQAKAFEFDAVDFASHLQFYTQLPQSPDVVINVFGMLGSQEKAQQDFDHAHAIIDANYTGCISILNIVANDMERREAGTIIGISSVAGERGRKSNYIYGSAKAAFSTYLEGMRHRLYTKGVHVMTVKPGFMRTQMTAGLVLPKPVTADPDQVAKWIFKAYLQKRNTLYTMTIWRWIMLLIKMIPDRIFYKTNL